MIRSNYTRTAFDRAFNELSNDVHANNIRISPSHLFQFFQVSLNPFHPVQLRTQINILFKCTNSFKASFQAKPSIKVFHLHGGLALTATLDQAAIKMNFICWKFVETTTIQTISCVDARYCTNTDALAGPNGQVRAGVEPTFSVVVETYEQVCS